MLKIKNDGVKIVNPNSVEVLFIGLVDPSIDF